MAGTMRGSCQQDTGAPWLPPPRLVQTGLDLVDFPTIAGFETDYLVSTMRQASRRSWRIGLSRPSRSSSWPTGTTSRPTPSSWWPRDSSRPWQWKVEVIQKSGGKCEVATGHWPEARTVQDWTPDVESAAVREAPGE